MSNVLASLSMRQKITIAVVAALVMGGIYGLIHWQKEGDFRPLFTGLAPEDAAGIVQKLKETGVEYRLPESGGSVLVPSGRLADLRLTMAAVGLPKTGRIGFELFDKTNLGATEFAEHVNYRRALEGELERSVMSLTEVEQARVHLTFPKESVFVEEQKPGKASVLVKTKPGARLSPQNVQAIDHLVASAVEGLSPDAVSVLDMNGNLVGKPKSQDAADGDGPSGAALEYKHQVETDLLAKVNSTLGPLLGENKFRAQVSVECDFSGGEQSEETYDPAKSVMLSSQRTEDSTGSASASGVPGTASSLPRPASRPAASGKNTTRMTENITYQSSRTVKKVHLPSGTVRKMSLAVLVDQDVQWQPGKGGMQRVLVPPTPEKLKVIHDLVAGITGFDEQRGDQLTIETLPFETTLELEPPAMPGAPAGKQGPQTTAPWPLKWDGRMLMIAGGAAAGAIVLLFTVAMLMRKRKKRAPADASVPTALPSGEGTPIEANETDAGKQLESTLAARDAMQHKIEAQALNALKLTPVITKAAEVMARHLREKIKEQPDISAQVLRTWIREEEN